MSSQHFPSSASLLIQGQVAHPMCVHVLRNHIVNVTFNGYYAVLSQIRIMSDLRNFCATFLSHKVRLRYFLRFYVCLYFCLYLLDVVGNYLIFRLQTLFTEEDKDLMKCSLQFRCA